MCVFSVGEPEGNGDLIQLGSCFRRYFHLLVTGYCFSIKGSHCDMLMDHRHINTHVSVSIWGICILYALHT